MRVQPIRKKNEETGSTCIFLACNLRETGRPARGLGELRDWASGGGPRASEQAAVAVRARASKGHGLSEWARQPARGLGEQRARRGLGELVRWRAGG